MPDNITYLFIGILPTVLITVFSIYFFLRYKRSYKIKKRITKYTLK